MNIRNALIVLSIALVAACGDKQKSESENAKSPSKTDPKSFVVGKWADGKDNCSTPDWVITSQFVTMPSGEKIPLVIDGDGSVVLGKDGPFLTPNFEANTLIYGGSESGDTIVHSKCK